MKYEVNYSYNGRGSAIIEAKSQEEAEEKFYNGDWEADSDDSDTYDIESVSKI